MNKSTNEILREAAEYIGEHGWCQNRLVSEGRVCARGAINAVTEVLYYDQFGRDSQAVQRRLAASNAAAIKLARHLILTDPDSAFGVAAWNDAPERTAEDVILALKLAAEEN